ncbi:MAG TPA: YhbY family RNA-binding protein [Gammaproteobacteria bacterium]|nr:YhbY family RNA-binding protein [Gammaproteobacteria bacterium]
MPESITVLDSNQRHYLKGLLQRRKVVVTIGVKGMTEALHRELGTALAHHELLKLRLPALSREDSQQLVGNLCQHHHATLVQHLGRVVSIYKPSNKPRITLPGRSSNNPVC